MYLSLAIPQSRKWEGDIYVVPRDPKRRQIKVTLEVPYTSSIKKLKQAIGERVGMDSKTVCSVTLAHSMILSLSNALFLRTL